VVDENAPNYLNGLDAVSIAIWIKLSSASSPMAVTTLSLCATTQPARPVAAQAC
jgi:hypothetical protein